MRVCASIASSACWRRVKSLEESGVIDRYAAIVNDGVVEAWFEEPGLMDNCPEDPYGVSSPENVQKYLQDAKSDVAA